MAEKTDRSIHVCEKEADSGEGVARLLLDRRLAPVTRRAADAALVERADPDALAEQMLPDRREEDVVVPIGRPRPWMHEQIALASCVGSHSVPASTTSPFRTLSSRVEVATYDTTSAPSGIRTRATALKGP